MKSADEQEFRVFLAKRNLTERNVKAHISIVKEFEEYLKERDSHNARYLVLYIDEELGLETRESASGL